MNTNIKKLPVLFGSYVIAVENIDLAIITQIGVELSQHNCNELRIFGFNTKKDQIITSEVFGYKTGGFRNFKYDFMKNPDEYLQYIHQHFPARHSDTILWEPELSYAHRFSRCEMTFKQKQMHFDLLNINQVDDLHKFAKNIQKHGYCMWLYCRKYETLRKYVIEK